MIDIEKFLISLRGNKDLDGRTDPIRLADTVKEEIQIVQAAVEYSRREWVGLTEEDIHALFKYNSLSVDNGNTYMVAGLRAINIARAIEAKLREKNAPQQSKEDA